MRALIGLSLLSGFLSIMLPEGRIQTGARMIIGLLGIKLVGEIFRSFIDILP